MSPEEIYLRLGQLIDSMPTFASSDRETQLWLGRAIVVVGESEGAIRTDAAKLKSQSEMLAHGLAAGRLMAQEVAAVMYRALARAEASVPAATQGAFLAAAKPFDTFAMVGKVLASAKKTVLIVDPYLDEKVAEYALLVPEGVEVRLLGGKKRTKPSLLPSLTKFQQQFGAKRPIGARLADDSLLHDRLIDVDSVEAWLVSQSFNALAERSPATIVRAPAAVAPDKLEYYQQAWASATPL